MDMKETVESGIVVGVAGGNHVVNGPLTVASAREASPSLIRSDVDSRIVKIRPMSTPIDQISRMAGGRPAKSMVVEYYSVDTKPVKAGVAAGGCSVTDGSYDGHQMYLLHTDNDGMFAATETLMLPTAECENGALVLYVVESGKTGEGVKVVVLNGDDLEEDVLAELQTGDPVVRMGRAASELDVQTAQFEALPVKSSNYCQIFKAQVEQSTYAKLSSKEVGWTLSDQEEVAIMDMRMGMEKNFLFGVKARLTDPRKFDEVLLTGGIWNQATGKFSVKLETFGQDDLVDLMKTAFTGSAAGSSKKIMIAGSDMIQAINKMEYTKVISASDTVTRWGIDFNELRSKFGSLYVIHSEIFDQCGHQKDALIVDPQYLTKYTHVPFRVERLDLKKSGLRNTDAIVATEASCVVLRHPAAHIKVTGR